MNDKDLDINEELAERLLDSQPGDEFSKTHTELAAAFSSLRRSPQDRVVEPTAAMTFLIGTLSETADDGAVVDAGVTPTRPAKSRLRKPQLALALVAACLMPILVFAVLSGQDTTDDQISLEVAQSPDDGDVDIAFMASPQVRADSFLSSMTAGATQSSDPFMACLAGELLTSDCESVLDVDCVLRDDADATSLNDDIVELDCLVIANRTDRLPNLVALTCARETANHFEMVDYAIFGCVGTDPPMPSSNDIELVCATDALDLPLYDLALLVCQLEAR